MSWRLVFNAAFADGIHHKKPFSPPTTGVHHKKPCNHLLQLKTMKQIEICPAEKCMTIQIHYNDSGDNSINIKQGWESQ